MKTLKGFPTLADFGDHQIAKSYKADPIFDIKQQNVDLIEKSAHAKHKYLTVKGEGKKKRYIYNHENMNSNEHRNAQYFHENEHRKAKQVANITGAKEDNELAMHHSKLAEEHEKAASQKGYEENVNQDKEIGRTKSGKSVYTYKEPEDYKDFTDTEHDEAADMHKNQAIILSHKPSDMHIKEKIAHHKSMMKKHNAEAEHINYHENNPNKMHKSAAFEILCPESIQKSMGVGNTPGHETMESGHATNKIGKTQSGKDVYNHPKKNENHIKGYTKQDHLDAAKLHKDKMKSFKEGDAEYEHHKRQSEFHEFASKDENLKKAKPLDGMEKPSI